MSARSKTGGGVGTNQYQIKGQSAAADAVGAGRAAALVDTDVAAGEHPDYPMDDWQYEVSNGDTRLGYAAWLAGRLESDADVASVDVPAGDVPAAGLNRPPAWRELTALGERLMDPAYVPDVADIELMRRGVLAAVRGSEASFTPADMGITDPDVSFTSVPGVMDGGVATCDGCGCVFRPSFDGDTVYPDRFTFANGAHGSRGGCGEQCGCHDAPYEITAA